MTDRPLARRHVIGTLGAGLLATAAATLPATPAAARGHDRPARTDVLIAPSSFRNYRRFENTWNYHYPWGDTHNGSVRMVGGPDDHRHISLSDGVLTLKATRVTDDDGTSMPPWNLPIRYHSGAVHAKDQVLVDDTWPVWDLRGEFQAPSGHGTWPAFWITGVDSWPPESDILEYKGTADNWFNTYQNPDGEWSSSIIAVDRPERWHSYRAVLTKVSATDVEIRYYLDGELMGTHRGADFVGRAMWIIINLQMEGSSGTPGPETDTYYRARGLYVARSRP
ncbi:LamG domain-containing protein [Streptomyces litchfieldiae]|uniref:Family 16 glycosylhydrolase n=1 Tax=Streptomyces litchfieldiae TaxID=3075543 RepID=A0ABU2MPJ8_9ACTN|nr:family 16 glycosylhydrolase [Streptomyces sp. DSM 44938]MDT0343547.1 family 16 glycosylhydrolase [Streptomyces sp. DSM 44938]